MPRRFRSKSRTGLRPGWRRNATIPTCCSAFLTPFTKATPVPSAPIWSKWPSEAKCSASSNQRKLSTTGETPAGLSLPQLGDGLVGVSQPQQAQEPYQKSLPEGWETVDEEGHAPAHYRCFDQI